MDQVPGSSSHFTRYQQKKIELAKKTRKQEKRIGNIFQKAHSGDPRTVGHRVDKNLGKIHVKEEFEVKEETDIEQETVKRSKRGEKKNNNVLIKEEVDNSEEEEDTVVVTVKEEVDIPKEEVDYDYQEDNDVNLEDEMEINESDEGTSDDDEMNGMPMESQIVIKQVTGAKKNKKTQNARETSPKLTRLQSGARQSVQEEDQRVLSLFKPVFEILYEWLHPANIDDLQQWEIDEAHAGQWARFLRKKPSIEIPPREVAEKAHKKRIQVHVKLTDLRQVCSTWCLAFDELVQENVIDCVAIAHGPYNLNYAEDLRTFLRHFGKDPKGPGKSRSPFIGRRLQVGTTQKGSTYWNVLFSLLKVYGKHLWHLEFSYNSKNSNSGGYHDIDLFSPDFRKKSSPGLTAHHLYLYFRQILKLVPNLKSLNVEYQSSERLSDTFIEEHPLPRIGSLEYMTIDQLPSNVLSNLLRANDHITSLEIQHIREAYENVVQYSTWDDEDEDKMYQSNIWTTLRELQTLTISCETYTRSKWDSKRQSQNKKKGKKKK